MTTDITRIGSPLQASRAFMQTAERLPVLWKLTSEFQTLIDLLEQEDADEQAIEAEMQQVAADIERKADGVAAVVRALESLAAYQADEGKRLSARAKANQGHADRLREYARNCMRAIGVERLETGRFTLRIQLNPPSVNVLDATAVPSEHQRTKVTVDVDRAGILAHYRATGEVVPGTEIVRNESLRIA